MTAKLRRPICGAEQTRNGMTKARSVRCKTPVTALMHLIQTYGVDQDEADLAQNTRSTINL